MPESEQRSRLPNEGNDWRVVGLEGHSPTAPRSPEAFVGRDFELGHFGQALQRAMDGRTTVVLVHGEHEVGKTALLREFYRSVEVDHHYLVAQCAERECADELGVIEQLGGWIPDSIVDPDPDGASPEADATAPVHMGKHLLALLEAMCKQKLVIVEFSDVQWADPGSVSALCYVLHRLRFAPLLVLASSSDLPACEAELVEITRECGNVLVPLSGLSVDEIRQLGLVVGGRRISASVARRLHKFTAGKPAHLRSLFRDVPLSVLTNSYSRLVAPASAQAPVIAALEGLPPDVRALLEGVAVQGTSAPLASAEQIGGVVDLSSAVAGAEASGLVEVDLELGSSIVRFRDAETASTVYSQIGVVRRAAAHERAAEITDDPHASLLHRVSAALRPDSALAAEAEAAAERQVLVGRLVQAADLLITSANLSGTEESRQRRRLRAAELLTAGLDLDRAADILGTIGEATDETGYTYVLGCLALAEGRLDEARQYLEYARSAATSATRSRMAEKCSAHLVVLACRDCRFVDAVALLGMLGDSAPITAGLESAPCAAWTWTPAPTDSPDATGEGMRQFSAAYDALLAGDVRTSQSGFARAVETFDSQSADLLVAVSTGYLAWAEFKAGRWSEAAEHFDEAIQQLRWTAEPVPSLSLLLALAAGAHANTGQWLMAEEYVRRIADIAAQRPERIHRVLVGAAQAIVARAQGDDERVVELLDPMRHIFVYPTVMWDVSGLVDYYVAWAQACIRLGRVDEVEVNGSAVLGARPSSARGILLWLHVQACLASGTRDDDKAERLFAEAMSFRDSAGPFEAGHLEFSYGAHLRRRGHRGQAASLLASAVDRFRSLGALPDVGRCEKELQACGPRNGDGASNGSLLTPRETSVSELVALGKSNQQIADALYVSRRTVEYHVSNVLRKLNVSSRGDVAAALELTGILGSSHGGGDDSGS